MAGEGLRQRIPWSVRDALSSEEIELATLGGEEAAETTAFIGIEEAAAGLDATGVGAPIGIAIGGLAALGFGAYEIYKHLIKSDPTVQLKDVQKIHASVSEDNKKVNEKPDIDFKAELDKDEAGFNPPPFKYLGPGNSLNRGPAYNLVDESAREHDIAYSQAKSEEDIYKADKSFISKSGNYIAEGISGKGSVSDTIGAVLGGVGIGSKHLLEKSINKVLYPTISGKHATTIKKRIRTI